MASSTPLPEPDEAVAMEISRITLPLTMRSIEAGCNGRPHEAIRLLLKTLKIYRTIYHGEHHQIALHYDMLGGAYALAEEPAEAEVYYEKALHITNPVELGGLNQGPRNEAALTRDALARLYEQQGKMEGARDQRLEGEVVGQMVCSNLQSRTCSRPGCLPRSELRACTGCHATFYHSIECQKEDWPLHGPYCKAYRAKIKAQAAPST